MDVGERAGAAILDASKVDADRWVERNTHHLDPIFDTHTLKGWRKLKRVFSRLVWAAEVEDGRKKQCPDCLRPLIERESWAWAHYEGAFCGVAFWAAADFVRGLLTKLAQVTGHTRQTVRRYVNQPIRRFRFRGCRRHSNYPAFRPA